MISRRESFKVFASGAAVGLTGAVIVATTSCVPEPVPAAERDPLLDLIREYREQVAIFNASPDGLTDEESDEVAAATMDPPWYRLRDACPVATTMEGAIEAVRLVEEELRLVGTGGFEHAVLAAARTYFDRGAA